MAIGESVRVREALKVLASASEDELKPYWNETEQTFRKLLKQLGSFHTPTAKPPSTVTGDCIPDSTLDLPPERPSLGSNGAQHSLGPSGHTENHAVSNQTSLRTSSRIRPSIRTETRAISAQAPLRKSSTEVQNFMSRITKNLKDLEQFVDAETPNRTKFQKDSLSVDVRIADMVATVGRRNNDNISKFDKLRRALGSCSLASEYESWVLKHTGQSTAPQGRPRQGCSGPFAAYIRDNQYRFGQAHNGTIEYALRNGRSLLDYERRLGGYLTVLIFGLSGNEPKLDVEELLCAIRSDSEVNSFAQRSMDWINKWRYEYDERCKELNNTFTPYTQTNIPTNTVSDSVRPSKRSAQPGLSNQSKRPHRGGGDMQNVQVDILSVRSASDTPTESTQQSQISLPSERGSDTAGSSVPLIDGLDSGPTRRQQDSSGTASENSPSLPFAFNPASVIHGLLPAVENRQSLRATSDCLERQLFNNMLDNCNDGDHGNNSNPYTASNLMLGDEKVSSFFPLDVGYSAFANELSNTDHWIPRGSF